MLLLKLKMKKEIMVMKKFDLHEMQNKFHNSQDEIERIMLQREFLSITIP